MPGRGISAVGWKVSHSCKKSRNFKKFAIVSKNGVCLIHFRAIFPGAGFPSHFNQIRKKARKLNPQGNFWFEKNGIERWFFKIEFIRNFLLIGTSKSTTSTFSDTIQLPEFYIQIPLSIFRDFVKSVGYFSGISKLNNISNLHHLFRNIEGFRLCLKIPTFCWEPSNTKNSRLISSPP